MIEVYVPVGAGKTTHVLDAVEKITKQAGGVTVFIATGAWYDKEGKIVAERVEVCRWFGKVDVQPLIDAMYNAGEESVLVVEDGKERFVEAGAGQQVDVQV